MGWFVFTIIYTSLSLGVAYLIHTEQKKYYKPLILTRPSDNKQINIHDEFPDFARHDKPQSFLSLFLGILLFFWIRFISLVLGSILIIISLSIRARFLKTKDIITKSEQPSFKFWISIWTKIHLLIAGIIVKDSRPDVKATYMKYFGNDYKIEYDTNYSMIISNHTSFLDTLLGMRSYGAGYIAKASVKNTPFIGPCAVRFQSLFVDRENSKDRQTVLNQIKERQEGMLSGTNPTPIIIYPEGTTTSGGHLLKFKRGAFNALLPLKPVMVKGNGDASYHVGCGNSDVMINYMRGFTKLFYVVEYIELPIMRPTEYMYEKYKHLGKDKVEVYSEVAREIYCEVGGFKKGNGSLRETNRYSMIMEKNKYISKEE